MKIAIIAHSHYPIKEPFAGGLEMITYLLTEELVARNHEVHLFAHPQSETSAVLRAISAKGLQLAGVQKYLEEIEGLDEVFLKRTLWYSKICDLLYQEDFDVVHNHSLHFQPLILGNTFNKPFVTTLHTPPFPMLQLGTLTAQENQNQTYTCVSERMCEIWSEFVNNPIKIYNGIRLSDWEFEDNKKDYLFCYGRMCEEKGIYEAIQFSLESGMQLYIAGPISDQDYFEQKVNPYVCQEQIVYLGHLRQKEIKHYLKKAAGTLFFSTWEEPYGLVIAESLASGTPVIAYTLGAAPELLDETCGIVLDQKGDHNTFQIIEELKKIKPKACRERAFQIADHRKMVDAYERLYQSLKTEKLQTSKAPQKALV